MQTMMIVEPPRCSGLSWANDSDTSPSGDFRSENSLRYGNDIRARVRHYPAIARLLGAAMCRLLPGTGCAD
jgi:hypothetical protein